MGRTKESATNPTEEQLARGRAFAAWLVAAINRSGLNGKVLAEKAGVTSTYIYDLRRDGLTAAGIYKRPSEAVVRAIAEVTGADVRDGLAAAGYDSDPGKPFTPGFLANLPQDALYALKSFVESLPSTIMPLGGADTLLVPVLGAVGAGEPLLAAANVRERIPIPRQMVSKFDESEIFALRVVGDCLIGLHIVDGDLLICRTANNARDRDVVVVLEGDEAQAKRYRESGAKRWVETVPLTGKGETIPLGDGAHIIGVQVGLYRATP